MNRWLEKFWQGMLLPADPQVRRRLAVATLLLVLVIGTLDYLTGVEISLFAFYCLPVALGTAAQGWRFGVMIALASAAFGVVGEPPAAAHAGHWVVQSWNALIAFCTYVVIVWLFATVRKLQREMQERVRQRTEALTAQIAERVRLEKILLEISERERGTIGRELHDNLGQHLTGTAFAGQVLGEKLQSLGLEEQSDAWRIVALIEEGIEKTRRLAKGLLLQEINQDGLVAALQRLAGETSRQFAIACEFQLRGECRVAESATATHLFRIAQEALHNAIRHGGASHVVLTLTCREDGLELAVRDHGSGLPPPAVRGAGLGLSIMAHRAQIMGGEFSIEPVLDGGTLARCRLPANSSHGN